MFHQSASDFSVILPCKIETMKGATYEEKTNCTCTTLCPVF